MGYRSDVVAIFYTAKDNEDDEFNQRNRAKLKLFVEENFPAYWRGNDTSDFEDCLTMLYTTEGRLVFEFKVSSVKWYEGYAEVDAFEQFWNKFMELVEEGDEGDDPIDWAAEFIRIGENTDDIEERCVGDNDWLIQVSRIIDRNY